MEPPIGWHGEPPLTERRKKKNEIKPRRIANRADRCKRIEIQMRRDKIGQGSRQNPVERRGQRVR